MERSGEVSQSTFHTRARGIISSTNDNLQKEVDHLGIARVLKQSGYPANFDEILVILMTIIVYVIH